MTNLDHVAAIRARLNAAENLKSTADAEALLKPSRFRVSERRAELGGIKVESSAVPYWDAVHALAGALSVLEGQQERINAVLALHTKRTRYGVVGWEEFSFDSEQDALGFVGADEADFLPFDICAHCGDMETHRQDTDDDPRQFESSAWPCPTVAALTPKGETNHETRIR